jgi:hypothetical protein
MSLVRAVRWLRAAWSPLLLRGLVLLIVGSALELAVPVGIWAASTGSQPSNSTSPVTAYTPSCGSLCGLAIGLVIIWNVIGIGTLLLGVSWVWQAIRETAASQPRPRGGGPGARVAKGPVNISPVKPPRQRP